ncbi:ATP-binding protein [Aliiglaciecola sp. LCG003]|uniref:ATP-binding protein n=1 Tax=Aliiglaciecola sp. LCG003 TaxID=3053655 RepID=UPI002572C45A|nr:ATP-binding protein [Aliiglaciecola sp. LCG003]WJG07954.1 ATP-binding protein [Aliiglaciecola sp. LCG003]
MILPQLKEKLEALKLPVLVNGLEDACSDATLNVDRVCGLLDGLLDSQIALNSANAATRMRKQAQLRWPDATLATSKNIKEVIQLSVYNHIQSCRWLKLYNHIMIEGPSGSGKTHLACAIGNEVIGEGYKVRFFRYRELVIQLVAADKGGELPALLKKLMRIDLLIIDDWLAQKLTREEQAVLFELIEKREKRGSLVITTQFDTKRLHESIGGDIIADAVLDRIVPMSYRINLNHNIAFRAADAIALPSDKENSHD